MNKGTIHAISISSERGQLKKEVPVANVIENDGIENDGHAGDWSRQVTCLSWGSVQKTNQAHHLNAGPGDFAENILIAGLDLSALTAGSTIKLGADVVLAVSLPSTCLRAMGIHISLLKVGEVISFPSFHKISGPFACS